MNKAVELARENSDPEDLAEHLRYIYEFGGDYKNALRYADSLMVKSIDFYHEDVAHDLSQTEALLGNVELERQTTELRMRNSIIILVAVIVVAMLVIFFVAQSYVRRRKHMLELEEKNKELAIARDAAEHASHVKTIFIQNMTHELHTPLNAIYGFAQVLADKDTPVEEASTREMSEAICKGSVQLNRLLDNIIEASDRLEGMEQLLDKASVLDSAEGN